MPSFRGLVALTAACVLSAAVPRPGIAAPAETSQADPKVAAKRLFDEGSEAYNLGNFEAAIEKFEAAYGLTRATPLLYNIAQAHFRRYELDGDPAHLRRAKVLFENFVRISEAGGEDPRDARDRVAKIEATLAGLATEPDVDPSPDPVPAPTPAREGPEPAPPAAQEKLPYRPGALGLAGYGVLGAGVLGGAALLVTGLVSGARLEAQRADESALVHLSPERSAMYDRNVGKAGALAFGGLGAGLGLAVIGAALVATDAARGRKHARRASLGAGGLALAF